MKEISKELKQKVIDKMCNLDTYDIEDCTPPSEVDELFEKNEHFRSWLDEILTRCSSYTIGMLEDELFEQEEKVKQRVPVGACGVCGEPIHYRYPCKCRRENNNPRVITLCGSTKFKKEFEEANRRFTMMGYVVISVGVFGHADGIEITEQEKELLDNIHLRKIDMSDEIFVVNAEGYIGSSTIR